MDNKALPDRDISNIEDIQLLVNTFYDKIKTDPLLGGIFNGVIKDRWPQHLEKMYRFWQTILLDEHTYNGRPFPPHAELPVRAEHFEAWLKLWYSTVDQFFLGPLATDAKDRGSKMAALFFSKIEYYRNSSAKPLF